MLLLRRVIKKDRESYEAFATGDEEDVEGDREAAR